MYGPQAVLLPGLDGTGALFAPFLRAWNRRPPPVVIDCPRERFLDYDGALDCVLARLPDSVPLVVVAESFSGPVGVALAVRLPERVRALVLCASFILPKRKVLIRKLLHMASPLLFRLPAPALLVREALLSGCDRLVPWSAAGELRAIRPATETVVVESPHFVLQAAPEESASAIERFLAASPP